MMCAIHAGRRGRSVLLLDHAKKLGGKILISGGGRCNFTNLGASPAQYVSKNPHFCKSALSRYPSSEFIQMVRDHGIAYHEKKLGQLFCDTSAQEIVDLLKTECLEAGAEFLLETQIKEITRLSSEGSERFRVETNRGPFSAESLVVATGGLSIPKIGATGLGYEIAQKFGLSLIEREPALDGFTFAPEQTEMFRSLAGASVDVVIQVKKQPSGQPSGPSFRESILFTHSGLSGPAALQASLHWRKGKGAEKNDEIEINLIPETNALEWFLRKKKEGSRSIMRNLLSELIPSRLADRLCELYFRSELPLQQISEKSLKEFCELLHAWKITPSGTVGYGKAEVTRGGVDTDELSSKTLEAKKVPGLHFIGEVVDVTGWLGGYNFQWAWASGWAAGQVV